MRQAHTAELRQQACAWTGRQMVCQARHVSVQACVCSKAIACVPNTACITLSCVCVCVCLSVCLSVCLCVCVASADKPNEHHHCRQDTRFTFTTSSPTVADSRHKLCAKCRIFTHKPYSQFRWGRSSVFWATLSAPAVSVTHLMVRLPFGLACGCRTAATRRRALAAAAATERTITRWARLTVVVCGLRRGQLLFWAYGTRLQLVGARLRKRLNQLD
jgi:hypothetical protein